MALRRTQSSSDAGLVQRCVFLHRDENGYGLTVSGDNPVYVQSVKENSGASKAGVQVHDKIIKVNGSLVTNSNHVEVVNLIKSKSYVALTLLGRSPTDKSSLQNSGAVEKSNSRPQSLGISISRFKSVDSDEIKPDSPVISLQRNLDQEKIFFQKIRNQYVQGPTPQSQKELADSQIRIRAIEDQLKALASGPSKGPFLSGRAVFRSSQDNDLPSTKPFPTHQRSQSVQGTKSAPIFNHQSPISSDYPPSPFDSPGEDTRRASDQGLFRQISESKIDYNSVPAEKEKAQKVPKRSVSLKAFPKFHDRHQPTTVSSLAKPPVAAPITTKADVNNTPTVKDNIPQIQTHVSHVRSKSEDEEDSVNSATSAKRPCMPNNIVEEEETSANMDNLLSSGKIESLQPIHSAVSVISMEDDEFELDDEKIDDHGPFLELSKLKSKPAHLAVFLHFLMSNSDPSALFFWLVTETYAKEDGSLKDLRKWAYEIFSTFVAPSAPMKIIIPGNIEKSLDEKLTDKSLNEDGLRHLFSCARPFAFAEVSEQLKDFRTKRSLGLGSLYGEHQLEGDLNKEKELKVVGDTLFPHLDALTTENNSLQNARNSAMASALTTFMKHVGVPTKGSGSQTNPLDRHKSFAEREKKSYFKIKQKKITTIKNHQFVAMQYTERTLCNSCDGLLWGIGTQGLQCHGCGYNVHKGACMESIEKYCSVLKSKVMPKPEVQKPKISQTKYVSKENNDEADSASLPVSVPQAVLRSRGNSFAEESSDKNSSSQPSEEQTFSDQEQQEKGSSKLASSFEETPAIKPKDSKKLKVYELKNSKLSHSMSGKGQRDFVKLLDSKDRKTLTGLPGLRLGVKGDGINAENGVYAPHPFPGRVESPPLSDDADDFQDDELDESDVQNQPWSKMVDEKVIKKLKVKEVKRQEVIHELINTEKTHVRNLKVLEKVFLKPMKRKQIMPLENIQQIFPNLEELIEIHTSLLADMNARCAEQGKVIRSIADVMLRRFDGTPGEKAKVTTAQFHHDQKMASEMLKSRMKKDPKLAAFMARQEESRHCRRLKFNDIMATTHQRLTKYPLLLREILKHTPAPLPEHKEVEKCQRCCKDILNHVNEAIAESENRWRLLELSKIIDKKALEGNKELFEEFKDFDLTDYKLMHEGDLTWKISRTKSIELHVLLLDLYMVLLQKQDDKLLLKASSTAVSTGLQDVKNTHSPIIKLQNLLTRDVATDKRAFFLVSTSSVGPQIYELVTSTITERNTWVKVITQCVDTSLRKGKERGRRGALCLAASMSSVSVEKKKEETPAANTVAPVRTARTGETDENEVDDEKRGNQEILVDEVKEEPEVLEEAPRVEKIGLPSKERVLELNEQLRLKDDEIKKMLEDKAKIIVELQGEKLGPIVLPEPSCPDSQVEARELVLAAILQANRLTLAVSDIFNLHQGGDNSNEHSRSLSSSSPVFANSVSREESVNEDDNSTAHRPQETLVEAMTCLNEQLTSLLSVITDEENVKERLTSNLQAAQASIKKFTQSHASLDSPQPEQGEAADIHPSASTTSVGSCNSSVTAPNPGIVISDDNSEEESLGRSELLDESKNSTEDVSQSPPPYESIFLLEQAVSSLEGCEV